MEEQKSFNAVTTIIKAGLIAGTFDMLCALAQFYIRTGKNPVAVLKFIASGVFGKTALAGGMSMALMGLFFHFSIAFVWTIIFFLVFPKISRLLKNKFSIGVVYGIVIWSVMTRIVLPLSNAPKIPFNIAQAILGILILISAFGIPISLLIHKYYANK